MERCLLVLSYLSHLLSVVEEFPAILIVQKPGEEFYTVRTNKVSETIWEQKIIIDLSEWNQYVMWMEPHIQGDQGVWSMRSDVPGLDECWETGGFGPDSATHNLGETE